MSLKILLFFACTPLLLFAVKVLQKPAAAEQQPWLTGPLITPSSLVVPGGHYNIEPYLYVFNYTGMYDSHWHTERASNFWTTNLQLVLQIGLTPWLDVQSTPSAAYNYTEGVGSWTFGDLPIEIDLQIYNPGPDEWMPAVKLQLIELFPTGKYDKLDPKKKVTDAGGMGAFNTSIGLAIGKHFHLGGFYFLDMRFYCQYSLPSAVHLQGNNYYGGGTGTDAHFFPNQQLQIDIAVEASVSRHWAFALDIQANWYTRAHFSGNPGVDSNGQVASLGWGSGAQFSLAPAIEYNWSDRLGLIAGSWFTVAGRNAFHFYSGVVALNYYH